MASGKLTWGVLKEVKEAVRNFHRYKEMLEKSIGVYDKERTSPKKKANKKRRYSKRRTRTLATKRRTSDA